MQRWLEDINWNMSRSEYTGKGVRVAIIDTGIDTNHPDLSSRKIQEKRIIKGGDAYVFKK